MENTPENIPPQLPEQPQLSEQIGGSSQSEQQSEQTNSLPNPFPAFMSDIGLTAMSFVAGTEFVYAIESSEDANPVTLITSAIAVSALMTAKVAQFMRTRKQIKAQLAANQGSKKLPEEE